MDKLFILNRTGKVYFVSEVRENYVTAYRNSCNIRVHISEGILKDIRTVEIEGLHTEDGKYFISVGNCTVEISRISYNRILKRLDWGSPDIRYYQLGEKICIL